ncbi:MAG: ABC transporter ATP-binding protein [Cytophagales bacterium]|jgi:putative ABC transport system ATP-binding protein|nr:ABC transporter ATP-binding protein [Cytophagales bacterium]
MLISVKDMGKVFENGTVRFEALKHVNFFTHAGDFTAIMGASGSGKSTFVNILGCLDRPTSGAYFFEGIDLVHFSNNQLAQLRRDKFGFIFQSFNLLPRTTVFDNVELPLLYHRSYHSRQRKALVLEAVEKVGLTEKLKNKSNELSGGQQQRVAIARALVNKPTVLFADEPTGNLDTHNSYEVLALFQALHADGTTIIMVTHEPDIAAFAQRTVVFKDGAIVSETRHLPQAASLMVSDQSPSLHSSV